MTDAVARLSSALADRYRIERELGAGGMATVYLAHDVRHDRKVALKVLRPELSAILGGARFLSEIKTTANLQHPHILSLFDSGEADGLVYYVMPFVEGESLRQRLNREKQLPVEEAVRIAREVASALDYAHRQGVVHRDIKPENVLLHEGRALVADFGIALAASRSDGGTRLTETGMSLGTPHYMAPEQAMGEREITPKADIYALGCVTYEMLTGEPPFTGPTAQAIVARVMTEQPRSVTLQRHTVPPGVDAIVRKALEKLPADRWATARDFEAALDKPDAHAPGRPDAQASRDEVALPAWRRRWLRSPARLLPWALALIALLFLVRERLRSGSPPPPLARFKLALTPPPHVSLTGQAVAFAPDGTGIVYVGNAGSGDQLYVRSLDRLEAVPVPGTAGAESPFFSPAGTDVAFYAGGKLLKVGIGGGLILPVCDVVGVFKGGTWSENATIVFADDRGLMRVGAAGGAPALLAAPDPGETFRWPDFLPGGRAVLFSIFRQGADRLAAATLASRAVRRFDLQAANPHWVRSGYVVASLLDPGGGLGSSRLAALPFDPSGLRPLGPAIPLADSVLAGLTSRTAKLGISRDGAMAYASGLRERGSLVSVARDGTVRPLGLGPRGLDSPRASPDGRRIAVWIYDAFADIWLFEPATRRLTRLTTDRTAARPLWTPDGKRIVYQRVAGSVYELASVAADGSGTVNTVLAGEGDQYGGAFTPDGRTLVYRDADPRTGKRRIGYVRLDSARTPHLVVSDAFNNDTPTLSPDGRWMAYVSDESGRPEVYVRPFPGPGGRWQISSGGGSEPRWSPTGREIFFRSGTAMMAVAVQAGASFVPGEPRQLFQGSYATDLNYPDYDVARDGRSFLMVSLDEQTVNQPITVVLNWFANHAAPGGTGPR
ncbi:MAG TPA: protein kinase [Gemmatimonadales bacterium]|nr:protein kinase [Gemmatimonadales bacterium]